jgi:hypothetical protein
MVIAPRSSIHCLNNLNGVSLVATQTINLVFLSILLLILDVVSTHLLHDA